MTQEALKLALEGVEIHSPNSPEYIVCAALIEALAQTQEPVMLLLQSKQNFERNFGPCWQADWIYSDLVELLDTTPPQRTWVGLTDEEYKELHLQMGPVYYYQEYGQAIEAKLKEKNT